MTKAVFVLAVYLGAALSAAAQKPPSWLRTLPEPDDGRVYGIGISDLGLDQATALQQARRRGRFLIRLFSAPDVASVELSTLIDPETGKATFEPRSAVGITLPLGSIDYTTLREEGRFFSNGVWFVLMSARTAAAGSKPEDPGVVRLSREGTGVSGQLSLSVQAWADSVVLDLTLSGEVYDFQSAYPDVKERIRISAGPLETHRNGPAWLRTKNSRGKESATDIVALKGRFSPFLSLVLASVEALGEFSRRAEPASVTYEDPTGRPEAPTFATVIRENRVALRQPRLARLQISRFASVYQTAVRLERTTD